MVKYRLIPFSRMFHHSKLYPWSTDLQISETSGLWRKLSGPWRIQAWFDVSNIWENWIDSSLKFFVNLLQKFLGCLHLFFKLPPNLSAVFFLVIFMIMGCLIFSTCRCFDVRIQCSSALLEFENLQKTALRKIKLTLMFFEISSSVETLSVVN